jgi:chemotaxis protein histidine kinase CheA
MYVEDLFQELRPQFLKRLPQKLYDLQNLLDELKIDAGNREVFEKLWTTIHQIHGTAGTYGLAQISEIAMLWDELLFGLSEQEQIHVSQRDLMVMSSHLDRLKQAVRKAFSNDQMEPAEIHG